MSETQKEERKHRKFDTTKGERDREKQRVTYIKHLCKYVVKQEMEMLVKKANITMSYKV